MAEGGSNSEGRADAQRGRTGVRIALIGLALAAVVGVAWVAGPSARARGTAARRAATETTMRRVDTAIRSYKAEKGVYPVSLQTLVNEKFFDKTPRDAWDRDMAYIVPGRDGRDYSLRSAGGDGAMGTADDLDVWRLGQ